MGVSKVVLGDETLIDLTSDSVSSENLLQGATAHGADGEEVIGGVVVTPMYTGTKAAIEEAIAAGQIPEDAIVNITDDEETSSFQTQINQINNSLKALTIFEQEIIGTNAILYKNGKYRELHLCGYDVANGSSVEIPIKPEDTPNYIATGCVAVVSNSNITYGQFGYYNGGSIWRLWSSDGANILTGKVSGVVTWIVD